MVSKERGVRGVKLKTNMVMNAEKKGQGVLWRWYRTCQLNAQMPIDVGIMLMSCCDIFLLGRRLSMLITRLQEPGRL